MSPVGGERSVPRILEKYGLSPDRVFSIIDGSDVLSYFFMSPINIDTLDGISRSMQSFGLFSSYNIYNLALITAEIYVGRRVQGGLPLHEMDRFWENKKLFYHILSSENPLSMAERRFQRVARGHIQRLERNIFNMTDREFTLRYPQLFREFNSGFGPEDIAVQQDFIINSAIRSVDKNTVYDRYVRAKHENRQSRAVAS